MALTRTVKLLCFTFGCFLPVSSVAVQPQSSVRDASDGAKQQVLELENQWVAAEAKHDAATLRRILDDKFIACFGIKPPYSKDAFIRHETSGEVDPTASQSITDESVVVDQDTAIVVATDTMQWTRDNVKHTVVARYTTTYIRRQGAWVAIAELLVEVPQTK